MKKKTDKKKMSIVFTGHVDHGKSTVIGRLLADTHTLPKNKLKQLKEFCERNSKPFEYAFLIDALKDERSQGITIDTARIFFKTKKRNYIILDAPGHIEFLKNMITGASHAEAAILVIDAKEGVQENSYRHGYMLSMLGIRQIVILINKMDLINYDKKIFTKITQKYSDFLKKINIIPAYFIPISGTQGDNITTACNNMTWYKGKTVLDVLDDFKKEETPDNKNFRMPVQGVYKFTKNNDTRRIIAGTILSGKITEGDEITFYPSGKQSKIKKIETFSQSAKRIKTANTGNATGFTLSDQIFISRGEIATKSDEQPPKISSKLKVNLFWLSKTPMKKNKTYILKVNTSRISITLEKINRIIDASNLKPLSNKQIIQRNDVAECIIKMNKAIAFDTVDDFHLTSRFVIIDDYDIQGGGIIKQSLVDNEKWVREKVIIRNSHWITGIISRQERAERYNQKPILIILTGLKNSGKKILAKQLEKNLFNSGKIVYYLGIGSIIYGIDVDIKSQKKKTTEKTHKEHIRRTAEVANILLDTGIILIMTANELTQKDINIFKTSISSHQIEVIWVGDKITTDITYNLHFPGADDYNPAINIIKNYLQTNGIIYKP